MSKIKVDILGLSTSSSSGGAYALILRETDGQRRLPIIIGAFEAQAIALEIEGIKPPRPMTHDLFKDVIETLGFAITEVTITELREGTFYARLSLDNTAMDEVDARPSDAIALAVRFGIPVFVAEEVLDEAGFVPEGEEHHDTHDATADTVLAPREQRLAELQSRLDDAINNEDYEDAAKIRDEILRLQSGD
ncbi:MAG: bifunctional nuclease family protein [Bacteroidia bacterium]|nr:bifunctional nuclease family protein [Bacteroidia bacterium]